MNSNKTASPGATPEAANRNLASISPFFIVKDLQTSISHYIERFGFKLDFQGPPEDVYYGHVSRDGIGIMLKAILPDVLPCPNHTRHEWAPPDAHIYSMDPDALFDGERALYLSGDVAQADSKTHFAEFHRILQSNTSETPVKKIDELNEGLFRVLSYGLFLKPW